MVTFRTWWDVAGNRAASPSMARAHTKVLAEADVRNTLARITAPTVILHRHSSRFVSVGHGCYLAEHIADHAPLVDTTGADRIRTFAIDEIRMIGDLQFGRR